MKINYRSFEDARKFVWSLGLKSQKEWKEYCRSGKRPEDIPSNPNRAYSECWKGFSDFLGTTTIPTRKRQYLEFSKAKKFVRNLNLQSNFEWREYCKSGNKPNDIPAKPERTYRNKGWRGYGDWLGTGIIQTQQRKYVSHNDAKSIVKSFGLISHKDWKIAVKNKKIPKKIPSAPDLHYKNKGWISWGDFLGTGRKSEKEHSKEFLSYTNAKKIVREIAKKYQIKTANDWREAIKKGIIPENIPKSPWHTYGKKRKNEKTI